MPTHKQEWDKSKVLYCGFGLVFHDNATSKDRYVPFNSMEKKVLSILLYFHFTAGGIKLYRLFEENPNNKRDLKRFRMNGIDETASNAAMQVIAKQATENDAFRVAAMDVCKTMFLYPNMPLKTACDKVSAAHDHKTIVGDLRTSINLTATLQTIIK